MGSRWTQSKMLQNQVRCITSYFNEGKSAVVSIISAVFHIFTSVFKQIYNAARKTIVVMTRNEERKDLYNVHHINLHEKIGEE